MLSTESCLRDSCARCRGTSVSPTDGVREALSTRDEMVGDESFLSVAGHKLINLQPKEDTENLNLVQVVLYFIGELIGPLMNYL